MTTGKVNFEINDDMKNAFRSKILSINPSLTISHFLRSAIVQMLNMSLDDLIHFYSEGHRKELEFYNELRKIGESNWGEAYKAVEDYIQKGVVGNKIMEYEHGPVLDHRIHNFIKLFEGGKLSEKELKRSIIRARIPEPIVFEGDPKSVEQAEEKQKNHEDLIERMFKEVGLV